MTEERLKEIKDSIDFQIEISTVLNVIDETVKEELELYNEVVRLRKIIDKANNFIEKNYYKVGRIADLSDILKQNNLTLEQLTGVENE